MPKLKPGILFPSKEEDDAINRGIASDPDTYELGGNEMKHLKRVGRPKSDNPKVLVSVRYGADTIDAFKASGEG